MRRRPLQCPFCNNFLSPPVDIKIKSIEITGGICRCGAIYALDRGGHNLGEVFMDALIFLCQGDIDKAMSLNLEDYETVDFDYDLYANLIGKARMGRTGKLIFLRRKDNS